MGIPDKRPGVNTIWVDWLTCEVCKSATPTAVRGVVTKADIGTPCEVCGDNMLSHNEWEQWMIMSPRLIVNLNDRAVNSRRLRLALSGMTPEFKKQWGIDMHARTQFIKKVTASYA